jgi:uncharacterized membrane protein
MAPWLDRIYREVDAEASRADRAEAPARGALLAGVFASAAILVAGLLIAYLRQEQRPNEPPDLAHMLRGLGGLSGVSIVYAGLLMLAATPVLRVGVMIGVYACRREWFMAIVSATVLGLLAVGILLGAG